jgi:hypothetical protein
LDIAAQELQHNGDPHAETVAAKIDTCVDDADRNLGDMYHVMNLQRFKHFFVLCEPSFLTFFSRHCPNDLPPQRISPYKERLELHIQGMFWN